MALPEKSRPGTLNGIQALRGIAACMVVVCHATLFWARIASPVPVGDPPNFWFSGGAGVDIFFIVSGFVMAVSTIGRDLGPHPALTFLKRRFIRVFPLYWVITALFAAEFLLLLHFPHWQTHGEVYNPLTKRLILSSVFLIPRNEIPLLGVAWTLIYECFFYLLFALALALRLAPARLLTPLMLALVLLGTTHFVSGPRTVVITNELLLEFLAGVFLGMAVLAQKKLNVSLSAVLGLIGIVFLLLPRHNMSSGRILIWGIPSALVVLAAVFLEDHIGKLWPKFILLFGDASYSLYLIHGPCLYVLLRIFETLGIARFGVLRWQDEWLIGIVSLIVCIAVSLLVYFWIEKPLLRFLGQKRLHKSVS
jgi:exopolysaccharide production protein ExoZ